MNKYKTALKSGNLNEDNITKKLRGMIGEHEAAVQEFNQERKRLSEMDEDDPEYDELSQELAELEETLLTNDDELCNSIAKFAKNKVNVDKMLEGRKKWMEGKQQAKPNNSEPSPAPAPPPAPAPAPAAAQGVVVAEKEEKEGGLGDWLFWGLLGGVGLLVGINIYKNR